MDINWGALEFAGGVAATMLGVWAKSIWTKTSNEFKVKSLEEKITIHENKHHNHGNEIQSNREKMITLQGHMEHLEDRMQRHENIIKEENKLIKETLHENTKAIASLNATMKGLDNLIKIVLDKFDK